MTERLLPWLVAIWLVAPAFAQGPQPVPTDAALESRVMHLATGLRCLVCQNQSIADSHAELAVDLRQQIREMLAKGMSDAQIRSYMTDRYGDFVLYKPPMKATTAPLWIGPGALLIAALAALFIVLRRRQRMAADAFDPDTPDDAEDFSAK